MGGQIGSNDTVPQHNFDMNQYNGFGGHAAQGAGGSSELSEGVGFDFSEFVHDDYELAADAV